MLLAVAARAEVEEEEFLPGVESEDINSDENFDQELLLKITNTFTEYFYMYENISIQKRTYNVPVYENIDKNEWHIMNYVINRFLQNRSTVDLWTINVVPYAAALKILTTHNKLPTSLSSKRNKKRNWTSSYDKRINSIRRKISYIEMILDCRKNDRTLTTHQRKIQKKLRKIFGNTKSCTLTGKLSVLKHELKVT